MENVFKILLKLVYENKMLSCKITQDNLFIIENIFKGKRESSIVPCMARNVMKDYDLTQCIISQYHFTTLPLLFIFIKEYFNECADFSKLFIFLHVTLDCSMD